MHITNDELLYTHHRVMIFISMHSILNNMLYIYIHIHTNMIRIIPI